MGFVRHLFTRGWDATVLTVTPDGESVDDTLSDRLPPSTRVVQTGCGDLVSLLKRVSLFARRGGADARRDGRADASRGGGDGFAGGRASTQRGLREWVTRLLQTPDSRIGWIPSAVRAGFAAIRRDKPEVIYSTSPYVSAHLVALILSWWTNLPWVADFRDPWGDNPFRDLRFKSLCRLDGWLERLVLKSASRIVMNTPTARAALCERFPQLAAKCSTITNGIDFDLIADVVAARVVPEDCFALTHCGQFYGLRTPQPWFDALSELRTTNPTVAERVRLVLVGADTYDGRRLEELAADAGVGDLVVVVGTKSHAQTLSIMAGSDALALATNVGAGSELQIPGKLFEYLGMGKAIVAAVDQRSPAKAILEDVGRRVSICAPGDVSSLASAILEYATRFPDVTSASDLIGVQRLGRKHRAAALAGIFDRLTGCPSVETTSKSVPKTHGPVATAMGA